MRRMTVLPSLFLLFDSDQRHNFIARHPKFRTLLRDPIRDGNRWLAAGLLGVLVVLTACTGSRLEGTSEGWSPVAVSSQVQSSRTVINEGFPFSESDTTLTVANGSIFTTGQTIVLGSEHLVVTSVLGNNLNVSRGADGTLRQPHPDGSPVSVLTEDVVTVYVTTRQGDISALEDDGFGPPATKWTFRPLGSGR